VSSTDREAGSAEPQLRKYLSGDSLIVAASLALAALLAWVWLLRSSGGAMDAMGAMAMPEPLSADYLLSAFAMWTIMMVAMMVPSAAPMFLLHARIDRTPKAAQRRLNSVLVVIGYMLVWTAFSAAAALGQALLVRSGLVSATSLSLGSKPVAAVLLLAAAAYELTAAKKLCLDKCQAPMLFVLKHWKPGSAGAFRLGLLHGFYCLGCCWLLMALLFAGGVMNLAWVALLGIVVVGEKLAPPNWHANLFVALALILGAMAVVS
jgi:predicted metal-binding membrane protein